MLTHENVVSDAAGVLRNFEVHVIKSGAIQKQTLKLFSVLAVGT